MVFVKGRRYIKKNVTKEWLKENGFTYNTSLSDDENPVYSYKFPIVRYQKKKVVIEGVINIASLQGTVTVDVLDVCNKCVYRPFYNNEYGSCKPILNKIIKMCNKEFEKFGITLEKK